MKKFKQFILVILVLSLVSCSFGFVDSNYYKQRRYSAQVSVDEIVDDSTDNAGDIVISEDEAAEIQNLFDTIGIDEHFDGKKLESWVFYVTDLSSSNVPSYKFDNNGSWENKGHYDFYPKHNNAGSGLKAISNLEYYRYKTRKARYIGENDFDPSDDPNFTEEMLKREERFLFFKFTGKSNGPALNNSIFAVDTHSKFCFLYDEPGNLGEILGNKVPSLWQDYADPRTNMGNNHVMAYTTPFYMYDPVGYVTEDGDVIVYDWAKKNIERSKYGPSRKFSTPAERSPDKPGYSPYLPEGAGSSTGSETIVEDKPEDAVENNTPPDTKVAVIISVRAKSIKNINMGGQKSSVPSGLISVFGHKMDVQFADNEPRELTSTRHIGEGIIASEMYTMVHGKEIALSYPHENRTHSVDRAGNSKFTLNIDLRKYGRQGFLQGYKTENEEIIITPEGKLHFEYNKEKDAIIFIKRDKGLGENVAISGYKDFIVKRGFTKDLVLSFTKDGQMVQVTFEIGVKTDDSQPLPDHLTTLKVKAKSIENVSIGGVDTSWGGDHPVDRGIFNYKFKAFGEVLTELNEKKEVKIEKNGVAYISNSKEKSLTNPTMDVFLGIELSKHDLKYKGFYNAPLGYGKINNCEISTLSSPVKLVYNSGKFTPVLPTSLPLGVTCSFVDTGFTLKKGETKDFSIKYTVNRPDVHCVGDVIVTYELSWE